MERKAIPLNILILTASTGGGHNRAADALKTYVEKNQPDTNVTIIDAIEECSPALNFTVVKGYKALVTLTPALFGAMYKSSDKKSPLSDTVNIIYQQCSKRLQGKIEELKPDAVISCHPFAGAIVGYMNQEGSIHIPLISIVTDFLPHRTYISDGITAYITASSQAKDILADEYGIDRDMIFDYGHPVFEQFYEGNGKSREEVLEELGFDKDKLTVLIMAGSFGVTDILEIYENLQKIDVDYQIIVITGRNQKLYDAFQMLLNDEKEFVTEEEPELLRRFPDDNVLRYMYYQTESVVEQLNRTFRRTIEDHKPTKLFFFINNVDDYMHASDLIVTKPGGLTTSESIACALPMVVFKAYPGQEEQNAALLVENNIGVILEESGKAAETVGSLLKDRDKLESMRESCRSYVRKNSCQNIIELAQRLAQENDKK